MLCPYTTDVAMILRTNGLNFSSVFPATGRLGNEEIFHSFTIATQLARPYAA